MSKLDRYEQELTSYWSARDLLMMYDRAKIALVRPKQIVGFQRVTLNKPKVLYDTSVSILSSFEPVMRLPWEAPDQTEEVRKKLSKAERGLIGMFREFNKHQISIGRPGGSWLYELAYWACAGWISWMPYIDESNGEVRFMCPFFDPITVYPMWTNDGLEVNLRRYYTTVGAARNLMKKHGWNASTLEGKVNTLTCKVVNCWEMQGGKAYNTVSVQGQIVKDRAATDFKEIPLKIIPVAGTAEGPSTLGDRTAVARMGENIIARNRETYERQDKITSFALQLLQDITYPGIMEYTASGEPKAVPEDYASGKVHTLKLDDEKVEMLEHANVRGLQHLMVILNALNLDEQKGGLPAIVHGGLPFEISGFMGSQLFAAVKYRLGPYLEGMRYVISWTATEILRQYRTGKFPSVTLATTESSRDKKRFGKGESFMEDFSPKDIPEMTYVDVDIPLATMVDKAQQMSFARQALADPQLISRETLWEEEFGIQDIDQELRRIDQDIVNRLPGVQIIMAVESLKSRAYEAEHADPPRPDQAAAFMKYAAMLEQQIPGGTPQPQGAPEGGPTPAGLPSEFGAAGPSPDITRAGEGASPRGGQPGARTRGAEARKPGGLWTPGQPM